MCDLLVPPKWHTPGRPTDEQESTFHQKPPHLSQRLQFSGDVLDDILQHNEVKAPSKFFCDGWVVYVFGTQFHAAFVDPGRHNPLSLTDFLFV